MDYLFSNLFKNPLDSGHFGTSGAFLMKIKQPNRAKANKSNGKYPVPCLVERN